MRSLHKTFAELEIGMLMMRKLMLICLAAVIGCAGPSHGDESAPARVTENHNDDAPPALTLSQVVEQTVAESNYRPSFAAQAATQPEPIKFGTIKAPLVSQVGEIVVLQGSPVTVSTLGDDSYGLVMTQSVQNPMAIAQEFYKTYPDEFNVITVFTTFPDGGSQESVAWYLGIRSSVSGVGAEPKNMGSWWGSGDGGQLHGFINMQYVGKYGKGLDNPSNPIHSVMAQEFGHQWGTFVKYQDQTGQISDALLGRDGAHWASTLNAQGSVMDGCEWVQTGDTKFLLKAKNYRYSELDQYIMGLRGSDEVADFYRIKNAKYQGNSVNPAWPLPNGITITGEREDVTIEQIIAAHGPRNPDYLTSPKDFRVAVVLVTKPDEDVSTLTGFIERLEAFRIGFEQTVNQMSDGRMRVCTQISAPCDSPAVGLSNVSVTEHEGNGDGVIDPGETVAVDFTVESTGYGDALDVTIDAQAPNLETLSIITPHLDLGDIGEGESVTSPEPMLIKIPPTVGCGLQVVIPVKLGTDGRTFPGEFRFEIGIRSVVLDTMDSPDDWTLNPYGTDTAEAGAWEIADPKGVDALYTGVNLITQPGQDHSQDGINALVTGSEAGNIGDHDVDEGVTSALSPVYDISSAKNPILSWYSWRFGYDFNTIEGIAPVENDVLYVEASTDGGKTWIIIDADVSNEQKWVRKDVRISNVLPLTGQIQLRITMSDEDRQSLCEALIDDIQIWDESEACNPPDPPGPPDDPPPPTTPEPKDPPPDDPTPEAKPKAGNEASGCTGAADGPLTPLGALMALLAALVMLRRRGEATSCD
jgi:hypothetical protein